MNEKLGLEVGVPVTVTFSFNVGKLCAKQWPGAEDTYARQTNDGRVLFFDAAEEMRLRKAVRAGQAVILCREKTASGSRYLTVKTPAPELKGALAVVHGRQIPDSKYSKPEPPAPVWEGLSLAAPSTTVANGAGPLQSAPSATSQAPSMANGAQYTEPITRPGDDGGLLGRCLIEALSACKVAQAHAAAIGLPTVFGAGEVGAHGRLHLHRADAQWLCHRAHAQRPRQRRHPARRKRVTPTILSCAAATVPTVERIPVARQATAARPHDAPTTSTKGPSMSIRKNTRSARSLRMN